MSRTHSVRSMAATTAAALLLTFAAQPAAALTGRDSTASAAAAADSRTVLLGYSTRFAGVTGDGALNVWEGAVGGELNGDLHLTVKLVGSPADAAKPVWRVKASVLVTADETHQAFSADLDGTIDWKAGTLHLRGAVVDGAGAMKGASVVLDGGLRDYDAAGTLRLTIPAQLAAR